jgi:carbonic anhydrase
VAKPKAVPATQALTRLIQGNKRFVKNRSEGISSTHRDSRRLQLKARGPFAIVLSCSDSRAPSELLFDQGLGDLFVIRVAGNIVAPSVVGSVELGVAITQAQLVVVMGHTLCGAIQATYDSIKGTNKAITESVGNIVGRIRPNIEPVVKSRGRLPRPKLLREAMKANVLASANHLRHGSAFLEERVKKGKLVVVGAEYCIDSGVVDFFDLPKKGLS